MKAATSDKRLALTNKAMLHAVAGLRHLKIPVPDLKTLQFEHLMQLRKHYFLPTKKQSLTVNDGSSQSTTSVLLDSLCKEEISALLSILLRCSACFLDYVEAINKIYRCA